MKNISLFISAMIFSTSILAGDAAHCIALVGNHSMKNTCDYKVHVFWCLPNSNDDSLKCKTGSGQHYYNQWRYIEAGEATSNRISIPNSNNIYLGACRYGDDAESDNTGRYFCN